MALPAPLAPSPLIKVIQKGLGILGIFDRHYERFSDLQVDRSGYRYLVGKQEMARKQGYRG